MAKWVTFYEDMLSGVHDLTIHDNRNIATEYFKKHYRSYFQMSHKTEIKLPMSYGFPHRQFIGMSKQSFEKYYGKIKHMN